MKDYFSSDSQFDGLFGDLNLEIYYKDQLAKNIFETTKTTIFLKLQLNALEYRIQQLYSKQSVNHTSPEILYLSIHAFYNKNL